MRVDISFLFGPGLGYVYTGPVRNGCGPIFGPDLRLSVYTGPFWNRSGTDPNMDLQNSRSSFGSVPGPVLERSRVNRSRSGPVRFGTVPDRSRVNVALETVHPLIISKNKMHTWLQLRRQRPLHWGVRISVLIC